MSKLRTYYKTKVVYDNVCNQKHTILVYGELIQTKRDDSFSIRRLSFNNNNYGRNCTENYLIARERYYSKRPLRVFNFGWAICEQNDEFNLEEGIKIAKRRFSDSPMTTTDVRFFSDDMINSILLNEIQFIENNLVEKYLPNHTTTCSNDDFLSDEEVDDNILCGKCYKEHENNVNEEGNICLSNINNGEFVRFIYDGNEMHGIVKSITCNCNYKNIQFYWAIKTKKNGWEFEAPLSLDGHKIKFLPLENTSDKEIYDILFNQFGIEWDEKNKSLRMF